VRAALRNIFTPAVWPPWVKVSIVYLLGILLISFVLQVSSEYSLWIAFAFLVVVAVGCTWVVSRIVTTSIDRILLLSSGGVFGAGAMAAFAWPSSELAQESIALALLLLLAATISVGTRGRRIPGPRSVYARLEAPFRPVVLPALTDSLQLRRYLLIRNGGAVLVLIALASLLLMPVVRRAMWGLSPPGIDDALILVDAIGGGLFTYLALGAFVESRFARIVGALGWVAAGSRLGPSIVHFIPTLLVPAFAYLLFSERIRSRSLPVLLLFPVALAFVAPALVLSVGIVSFAASFAIGRTPEARRAVGLGILGCIAGGVLTFIVPSLFPTAHIMIGTGVDERLRQFSADGAFPWEILYPSLTGGLGPIGTTLYAATGRVGNVLMISSSVGEAAIVAFLLAWVRIRRWDPIVSRFAAGLLVISMIAVLPSRVLSVPLPTLAALAALVAPNSYFVAAASLGIALAGAVILGSATQVLERTTSTAALGVVLLLLAAQVFPNRALIVPRGDLDMAAAVDWVSSAGGSGILFASRYADDPWASYGRYALTTKRATAIDLDTLPPLKFTVPPADRRACYAIVNYSAYDGYDGPGLNRFLFVPTDFSSPYFDSTAQEANLEIKGLSLLRVYGNVIVYKLCR
jgi:hypothetical protein